MPSQNAVAFGHTNFRLTHAVIIGCDLLRVREYQIRPGRRRRLRGDLIDTDGDCFDMPLVLDFTPPRFVYWMQDELVHFQQDREASAAKENKPKPASFSLHDLRRTTITNLQMEGLSDKKTSLMVGATPEVIRKHYERLDAMIIERRAGERRLAAASSDPTAPGFARRGGKPP